ncbi:hypothetical protein U1Q18_036743 [Sarracenia purpurea var. burkii]
MQSLPLWYAAVCEGAQQWRAEHSGGRIEQRRRRRAKLVRRGLTVVRWRLRLALRITCERLRRRTAEAGGGRRHCCAGQ